MNDPFKIILDKYPDLFESNFYFEINEGWFDLIEDLCLKISELGFMTGFKFTQIKEKFGTARIYHTGGSKQLDDLIHEAEMTSAKVCEECGEVGDLDQTSYWLRTLCDLCTAHRNVVKGLNLAASKTHCKTCIIEIKKELEMLERKHAIELLSRHGQK